MRLCERRRLSEGVSSASATYAALWCSAAAFTNGGSSGRGVAVCVVRIECGSRKGGGVCCVDVHAKCVSSVCISPASVLMLGVSLSVLPLWKTSVCGSESDDSTPACEGGGTIGRSSALCVRVCSSDTLNSFSLSLSLRNADSAVLCVLSERELSVGESVSVLLLSFSLFSLSLFSISSVVSLSLSSAVYKRRSTSSSCMRLNCSSICTPGRRCTSAGGEKDEEERGVCAGVCVRVCVAKGEDTKLSPCVCVCAGVSLLVCVSAVSGVKRKQKCASSATRSSTAPPSFSPVAMVSASADVQVCERKDRRSTSSAGGVAGDGATSELLSVLSVCAASEAEKRKVRHASSRDTPCAYSLCVFSGVATF